MIFKISSNLKQIPLNHEPNIPNRVTYPQTQAGVVETSLSLSTNVCKLLGRCGFMNKSIGEPKEPYRTTNNMLTNEMVIKLDSGASISKVIGRCKCWTKVMAKAELIVLQNGRDIGLSDRSNARNQLKLKLSLELDKPCSKCNKMLEKNYSLEENLQISKWLVQLLSL